MFTFDLALCTIDIIKAVITEVLMRSFVPVVLLLPLFVLSGCLEGESDDDSSESSSQNETRPEVPEGPSSLDAPANLVLTELVQGEVRLTWDRVEDAADYVVYVAEEPFSTVEEHAGLNPRNAFSDVRSPLEVRQLDANSMYYFRVQARLPGIESPLSDQASGAPETNLEGLPEPGDLLAYAVESQAGDLWQRCYLGASYDVNLRFCQGDALLTTPVEAQNTELPGGWRMPTPEELQSIIYCSTGAPSDYLSAGEGPCEGDFDRPTLNTDIFDLPQVAELVLTNDPTKVVSFSTGSVIDATGQESNTLGSMRLIRDEVGPAAGTDIEITTPHNGQPVYTVNSEEPATLTVIASGDEWLRCPLGTRFSAAMNACQGTPVSVFIEDAAEIVINGKWRVPSATKLREIVYCDNGNPSYFAPESMVGCSGVFAAPTVVPSAFPGASESPVLSSTLSGGEGTNDSLFFGSVIDFATGQTLDDSTPEVGKPIWLHAPND